MLDADLADLYKTSTKALNQAVKRNRSRFSADFMFQLTREEKAEVVTHCYHLERLKFSPALPHAFTEYGTIMLANVLNSQVAIQAPFTTKSRRIARNFGGPIINEADTRARSIDPSSSRPVGATSREGLKEFSKGEVNIEPKADHGLCNHRTRCARVETERPDGRAYTPSFGEC